MIDERRLKILTEGAKYDVSCSSSGSKRKNEGGMGNGYAAGCCHSFTPDGRCISLLKILMSNDCVYNCKYCPNRLDADVPRVSATPEEIAEWTYFIAVVNKSMTAQDILIDNGESSAAKFIW